MTFRLLSVAALMAVAAQVATAQQPTSTAQQPTSTAQQPAAPSYPTPYRLVENPLTLPQGRPMGWVFGIDVGRNGKDIWIFDYCGGDLKACASSKLDPIMRFDASGKLVKSFGAGMFLHPHGLYVDRSGNVWVADGVGGNEKNPAKGFQVFKFSPDGKLLMTLGTAAVKGKTETTFNMPTDIVVARNGDIFISDGGTTPDTNARIVKFDKHGKFIKAWGTPGKGPGQFSEPHSVALDSRGRLFVADRRDNARIQIFDQDGKFLDEWTQFGYPSEIYIDRDDNMYVSDIMSKDTAKRGIYVGSAKDGKVTAFIPLEGKDTSSQELVVADRAGNVYGAYSAGAMVRKYVKK